MEGALTQDLPDLVVLQDQPGDPLVLLVLRVLQDQQEAVPEEAPQDQPEKLVVTRVSLRRISEWMVQAGSNSLFLMMSDVGLWEKMFVFQTSFQRAVLNRQRDSLV
jgi:hypothetical protein